MIRPVSALFFISTLLFVSGLGFLVIGARERRDAPAAAEAPPLMTPVASVGQIMQGIVNPAADTVFNAVSTTVTASGTDEKAPQTPEEWATVASAAAVLVESGNLLLVGSRAVDQGDWSTYARDLVQAGSVALKAAEAMDAQGVFASGEAIYNACDNCHRKYERTE